METLVEQLVSFHRIQVQLSGGAPWGFTLKGGTEHGEPLVITKIEEGGKAARCRKLKVGDELININESALYGSRQEALILIKGSYRILKLGVRRRSIPHIRPPSWLPPPPQPCTDSPSSPPPPPVPPAMQLHPTVYYTLTWNAEDNSDLSMQWGQLCRPYSSTDQSSSLGSMESLDIATPMTQPYSDSRSSPVDPPLSVSKRDSAYSSFSAGSNMSDYAVVPLRPGEDNSLQGLRSSCPGSEVGDVNLPGETRQIGLKFRSLTRPRSNPLEVKERASSVSHEDYRRESEGVIKNGRCGIEAQSNSDQFPNSFEEVLSCPNLPNKRRASAPTDMSYTDSIPPPYNDPGTQNGFLQQGEDSQMGHFDCYIPNQKVEGPFDIKDDADMTSNQLSCLHITAGPEVQDQCPNPQAPIEGYHWQVDPQQAELLQYQSNNSSPETCSQSYPSDHSCCSRQSPVFSCPTENQGTSNADPLEPPITWNRSCCSTPASDFLEDEMGVNRHCHQWGRSFSVPEDPSTPSKQCQILPGDFQPLSAAASVDTLIDEQKADESERNENQIKEDDATIRKPNSSKNNRRNRRRSERFATNLRHEIQRKKAQLQKSGAPPGPLPHGEIVQEEDAAEDSEDPDGENKLVFVPPVDSLNQIRTSDCNLLPLNPKNGNNSTTSTTAAVQIVDTGVPNFGVGVRVVEEPAPAGKARRWRWTPEHKLQPEPEPVRVYGVIGENVLGVTPSSHGVCAFTSTSKASSGSSASSSSQIESDILPFADRRKFFEETSKSVVGGAKLPGVSTLKSHEEEQVQYTNRRRYSYQGGIRQEMTLPPNSLVDNRSAVCSRQRTESEPMREWEENARKRQDKMFREMQQEKEKEGQRERVREKEQRERVRQWEYQVEPDLERPKETENLQREPRDELERQRKDLHSSSYIKDRDSDKNHSGQVESSAFYRVETTVQPSLHPGFSPRSHTPTQYPTRQHKASKLNRNYSLTERDWRQPADATSLHYQPSQPASQIPSDKNDRNGHITAPLSQRGRAVSENDLRVRHRSPSRSTSHRLSEVVERTDGEEPQKKAPPPRPPPPNWEQFHRRRASHHAFSCTAPPIADPCSLDHSTSEPSRQRSYSLPPQRREVVEFCSNCHQSRMQESNLSHVPSNRPQYPEPSVSAGLPSPVFSRRAFRPIVPTNGHLDGDLIPESFYEPEDKPRGVFNEPQKVNESESTCTLSPTHSLDVEQEVPIETDIDDFQEEDRLSVEELLTSELPCFALPVTVLETDIDSLPVPRAKPVSDVLSSAEEEFESSREKLSLDEFFPHSSEGESVTESWRGAFHNPEHSTDSLDRRSGASSSCSSYYSTSTAKAQLLSQMKELTGKKERDEDDELTYKRQLMESLRKKLGVLREAQRGLQDDVRANSQLGEEVESMVVAVCKPNEVDKFRMFIGDLDKVVSLLLSLSGRLLRVETALDTLDPERDDDERLSLLEKKRQLMRQLSEAQDLRDHVDRREQVVSRVLARCLSPDQHRDYSHFVKMKAALLVEQKQLEDKIRLGEEQLRGLRESLGLGLVLGIPLGFGFWCGRSDKRPWESGASLPKEQRPESINSMDSSGGRVLNEDQFCCSICLEVFVEPVSTPCGHSFCKACLQGYWTHSKRFLCPMCKKSYSRKPEMSVNRVLAEISAQFQELAVAESPRPSVRGSALNLSLDPGSPATPDSGEFARVGDVPCDACIGRKLKAHKSCVNCPGSFCETHLRHHKKVKSLTSHRLIEPTFHLEEKICKKHERLLEVYCRSDHVCVCKTCIDTSHKSHDVVSVDHEWKKKMSSLGKKRSELKHLIKERAKTLEELKQSIKVIKCSAQKELEESWQVYAELQRLVEQSQAELVELIATRQREAERHAQELARGLENELSQLRRRSHELDAQAQTEDKVLFLQRMATLPPLPEPNDWSAVSVNTDLYLGTIRSSVGGLVDKFQEELKRLYGKELRKVQNYSSEVILDPATAQRNLALSEDGRQVRYEERKSSHSEGPKRFSPALFVLGRESLNSGRHYWEVDVARKTAWTLGVANASAQRKGEIALSPAGGYWCLWLKNGQVKALASSRLLLPLPSQPAKVGIFLDYEAGQVSFYDPKSRLHLYTFLHTFNESLYPIFSPCLSHEGKNTSPLAITPVKHT
ncbi:protein Shroom4-like [Stigmatopora nigra]